jgi:hypothetical protein
MASGQRLSEESLTHKGRREFRDKSSRKKGKMITGEQVKAAWSQEALWLEAGVGPTTLKNFETGQSRPSVLSVTTIQRALEAAGVEFTNGGEPGVKLKAKPAVIRATWDPPPKR